MMIPLLLVKKASSAIKIAYITECFDLAYHYALGAYHYAQAKKEVTVKMAKMIEVFEAIKMNQNRMS